MTALICILLWIFFSYITYDLFIRLRKIYLEEEPPGSNVSLLIVSIIAWPFLLTLLAVGFIIDNFSDYN